MDNCEIDNDTVTSNISDCDIITSNISDCDTVTNISPSQLLIEIDYRESKILKLINAQQQIICNNKIYGPITINNIPFYYKISNLTVGDFIFKKNEEILFIIERKCINDLSASIIDGRFKNQKQRLLDTNLNIVYIIEGSVQKYSGSIPKTTLKSSILNLIYKYNNFKVIKSECEKDTLDYLLLLYKKIINNDLNFHIGNDNSTLTIKKKSDYDNIFINQLTCIHGVSEIIAKKIVEKYKSMNQLINTYNNLSTNECENLLIDIMINEKRKLGKSLSKKIYHNLVQN